MLIRRFLNKRRLAAFVALAQLIKRAYAVDKPRFEFVKIIRKKSGPEPEDFGTILRDRTTGKEYVFEDLSDETFLAVRSIKEIEKRPQFGPPISEDEYKQLIRDKKLVLKNPDIDIENAIMAQFETSCKESGREFDDMRERTATAGTSKAPVKTPTPSQ